MQLLVIINVLSNVHAIPIAKFRLNAANRENKKRRLLLQPIAVFEQVTLTFFVGFIMLIHVCLRLLFNFTF